MKDSGLSNFGEIIVEFEREKHEICKENTLIGGLSIFKLNSDIIKQKWLFLNDSRYIIALCKNYQFCLINHSDKIQPVSGSKI